MLNKVTILITSFYRPGYLLECLKGIRNNLPECDISVAIDDDNYSVVPTHLRSTLALLPFDSGLTAKRNEAVKGTRTEYALLGSDDYNFSAPEVREGIKRMVATLDAHSEIDVVVGTYNGMKYEGTLEYKPGEYIMEHYLRWSTRPMFETPYPAYKIEMGINYFLARTSVLKEVPWDETIRPIGGEHGDWYMMMKQAGKTIVWVPGCNIESFSLDNPEARHPDYFKYRNRAQQGHQAMLKKWGIKEYWSYHQGPRG